LNLISEVHCAFYLFVVDDTSAAEATEDHQTEPQPASSAQDPPPSTGGVPSTNISKPPTQSSTNVPSKPPSPPGSNVDSMPPQEDVTEGDAHLQEVTPPKETKPVVGIFLQTAAFLLEVNALQVCGVK
jgi:hypothetical protein